MMGWRKRIDRSDRPRRRRGLAGLIKRRLFWRFYLMLLASLMIMVVIGGFIWRTVAEAPYPAGHDMDSRLTEALLPPADAPDLVTRAAIANIAASLDARVILLGADGQVISTAGRENAITSHHPDLDILHLPRGRTFRTWRIDLSDGRILAAVGTHGFNDGPPPGFYYLFLVGIGIGVAAFPFVLRITRRLERLRQAVEDWGEGHLDTRVLERGGDEIASVSRSFNIAAARIQSLITAHRTLLANASHELRSPLARLRMAVEVYKVSPNDDLRGEIVRDIAELDQLVEEILLASRLEHSGSTIERDHVDVLGLAAEEAARVDATLLIEGEPETLVLQGSSRLLRRLVRNLLENAIRHGAPPVEIAVRFTPVEQDGSGHILITVTDRGPGIPEAERQRVFEPFYRPAGHSEAGGSWGLGLALVSRIAASHGGIVSCSENPGGGARFVVTLPITIEQAAQAKSK